MLAVLKPSNIIFIIIICLVVSLLARAGCLIITSPTNISKLWNMKHKINVKSQNNDEMKVP